MTLVDRLNAAVVARLRQPAPVPLVDGTTLCLGKERLDLRAISEAVAHRAEAYASDLLLLTLRFADGRAVTVAENDLIWPKLLVALDEAAAFPQPSREWLPHALTRDAPLVLLGVQP